MGNVIATVWLTMCGTMMIVGLQNPTPARPAAGSNELAWSTWLAAEMHGAPEYRLPEGSRVDILTDDVAWEVEWVDKWPESIGQALFYGIATDRTPGVVLLLRGNSDEDYLQCLMVIDHLRSQGVAFELRVQPTQ